MRGIEIEIGEGMIESVPSNRYRGGASRGEIARLDEEAALIHRSHYSCVDQFYLVACEPHQLN